MSAVLFDKKPEILIDDQAISGVAYTEPQNLETAESLCYVIKNDVQSLVAIDFISEDIVGAKIFSFPHPYTAGLKVRFTTTGTLPSGLDVDTDYYLTNVNGFGFEVAASANDAQAGVFINISGGSGVHTVIPQPFGLLNLQLQASIDETVWADITYSRLQSSKTENLMFEINNPVYRFIRIKIQIDSGQSVLNIKCLRKGRNY